MKDKSLIALGLDVGEKRIGVALGDSIGKIAAPLTTLTVDGTELIRLQRLLLEHNVTQLVVGLPRNLSGAETKQSELVRLFVKRRLEAFKLPIAFQDESVTSVLAEQHLVTSRKKPAAKEAIDAHAAAIILQDYLEGLA
jgi:putative Holliday junction resolvase